MIYKAFIILLCVGIVAILFGMAFIDCMSLFKIGFYTILSGALITSVGFVGIMFLLLGIGAAIIRMARKTAAKLNAHRLDLRI